MKETAKKWLTDKGFVDVRFNQEESTEHQLRYFGEDHRGFFLEFLFDTRDGYMMDRNRGSKYWDITGNLYEKPKKKRRKR